MRAKLGNFPQHKKIAKVTFPLWLYVAITGVVVYLYDFTLLCIIRHSESLDCRFKTS